jgi:methionyl-tRNA synthetase
MLYPFLPFSSQKLHRLLGYQGKLTEWKLEMPVAGQKLAPPEPLFIKLEDKAQVTDTSRSGGQSKR